MGLNNGFLLWGVETVRERGNGLDDIPVVVLREVGRAGEEGASGNRFLILVPFTPIVP